MIIDIIFTLAQIINIIILIFVTAFTGSYAYEEIKSPVMLRDSQSIYSALTIGLMSFVTVIILISMYLAAL